MEDSLKVQIVEDEALTAEEIRRAVLDAGLEVVGIDGSGAAAYERARASRPSILLVDIALQGHESGIELVKRIQKIYQPCIIYITALALEDALEEAKATNPQGFLLKPIRSSQVIAQIAIAVSLWRQAHGSTDIIPTEWEGKLPIRQRQILTHFVQGRTSREIANEIGLSEKTVRNHLSNLYRKFAVKNRSQLLTQLLTKKTAAH